MLLIEKLINHVDMLENFHQCRAQCVYSMNEGSSLSKTGEAARSSPPRTTTHPCCWSPWRLCVYFSPGLHSQGRKAQPGHKDPQGHSGGFLRPQERNSLILLQEINNLFEATGGLSGSSQSRKVSPARGGFQPSVSERDRMEGHCAQLPARGKAGLHKA